MARLRSAFASTMARHPFTIHGPVILPDHVHLLIKFPAGDSDYSMRMAQVKSRSKLANTEIAAAPASKSRQRRRERAVWQRRCREHTIRDPADFEAHMYYIHYNPVKHGVATGPHAKPHSSFARWVRAGRYAADWACACFRAATTPPNTAIAERTSGE